MKSNKTVEEYLAKQDKWHAALQQIRQILLATELDETIKWGMPTYTLSGKNVVGMAAFKEHFGIWFFQGGLLKDEANLLVNAQEGKTKAMRQMRFEAIEDIQEDLIKTYVAEAIANQKAGKAIKADRKKPMVVSEALDKRLTKKTAWQQAFQKLTPGKQREYAAYIQEAKREATKQSRLDKIIPMILEGKGLNDKYK